MTIKREMITVLTREEMFEAECTVIVFADEYPGYFESIPYGIITELSRDELEKYKDITKKYEPFLILDNEFRKVRNEYRRNERNAERRFERYGCAYGFDELTDQTHVISHSIDFVASIELRETLNSALNRLTTLQKRRLLLYCDNGFKLEEIALLEHCTAQSAKESIDAAKEKQVSDFLTYKKIPNLTVTLGKLFSDDKYYSVDWIDFDTMVKLCVKRTETSNMITFCFQKVGNELDFPQVSTMITTNNGGTQNVEWSYENIDSALIELLLADGFIQDNGGYYAAK
ncbi:MAG: hypothetical protein BWY46_00013 [Firmicutes bacterium ADurb.Bin300]|nr:MAG: hypothetical protein BWY46_00013 [Firmicutes bacterium ADurb.Bin300]